MKWAAFAGLCAAIFSLGLLPLFAATKHPIAVLIVDGQSAGPYHDWQLTTQVLRKELEETALFQVTVATSPESGGDFSSFKPKFSDYAVIVWNYDAPNWPADLRAQLEQYVSNGGGLVVVIERSFLAFPIPHQPLQGWHQNGTTIRSIRASSRVVAGIGAAESMRLCFVLLGS